MASGQTTWQDGFLRECGIRRGIILHGNVVDVVSDPSALDRWRSVPDAVDSMLKQRGYRHVVRWDRVGGVSGVDSRTWRELAASATQPAEQPSPFFTFPSSQVSASVTRPSPQRKRSYCTLDIFVPAPP